MLNAGTVLRVDFKLRSWGARGNRRSHGCCRPGEHETSRLSQTVDSTQIANLPLNGRNVYDLIQYAPGATNMRGTMFENGANTVVNGVRENFNGFVINGVSNKGLSGGAGQPADSGHGAGVPTADPEQLGRVWQQRGSDHQSGDQVGDQRSPRKRLGILPQRCARCQSVFRQSFCRPGAAPEDTTAPEPVWGNAGWSHS